ncbi:MAG: glycoside hydrolase family 97 N-terminal domain-containing protein, partial [Muribaculaceae bacterium]|nr:glycoside hydrolase family 97 N-terminal domain-containing protein [Muribaculaceae bacterium]
MNNKILIIALAAVGGLAACSSPSDEVTSPDGKIKFSFDNNAGGLFYSVTDGGVSIVSPSRLGFVLEGNDSVA